jgi:20S proteasome alpha/beta subunit
LTYIAGMRCSDGVVLVGDRKVVSGDGTKASYENKLTMDVSSIVVGYAGSDILSRRFRSQLVEFAKTIVGQAIGFEPFVEKIEDIVTRLNQRYRDKVASRIEVLIAAKLAEPLVGLRYVHEAGVADEVASYKAIGSGEPFGDIFLKLHWQPGHPFPTMQKAAEIGHFIIKYIEKFQLDDTVGVGNMSPQIWFLPNTDMPREVDSSILQNLEEITTQRLDKIPQSIVELF